MLATRVGYTGGYSEAPTYKEVCSKITGHAEAVEVTFDPEQTDFAALAKFFFEIHDPTIDRTGKGGQYRSAIFYTDAGQLQIAQTLIRELAEKGIRASTKLERATTFWPAEARHQKYCDSRGMQPVKSQTQRFDPD